MKEIISLRKAKEKHFLCEDGTFKAFCYKDDIHYLDNGEYKEIDNTLIKQEDYYINKSNDFNVMFTSCVDKNLLYKILLKDKFLEVLLEEKKQDNNKIEVKNNEITYINLLENVDFKYEIIGKNLKETIILNQNNYSQIRFILRTNLNLKLNNNVVYAYDNDTLIYKFESPFVYNDEKNLDINLEYELNSYNDCYELILKFDKEKLNNVLFPIYIDPTISTDTKGEVYDTYIYPNDESVDRNNQDYLKIGVDSNNVIYRSLLKFDLPTIGSASQVVNATLYLTSHPIDYRYPLQDLIHEKISVHEIISSWTEETANWNSLHDKYNHSIETYSELLRTEATLVEGQIKYNLRKNDLDITNIVKKWYTGTNNNGIMLKSINETYNSNCKEYYMFSKNNNAKSTLGNDPKPYIEITYQNTNGLPNNMPFYNIPFRNGETSINLFNGNMVSHFGINSLCNSDDTINLSLVYNTNDAILNNYLSGWRFNLSQKLIVEDTFIKYIDSSSCIKYFKKKSNNEYVEEKENKLKILLKNNEYILTDEENIDSYFTLNNNEYLLTKITKNSNVLFSLKYDSNNRIIKIINKFNEEININYESNQILIKGVYASSTILFSNNMITKITTQYGSTSFIYEENVIKEIIDSSGKKVVFNYYENNSYKIKCIKEIGLNNEEGKSIEYSYGFNTTKETFDSGVTYTYIFDNNGNATGTYVISSDGKLVNSYGINLKYNSNFTLSSFTKALHFSKNQIDNGDFETNNCSLIEGGSRTTEISHCGKYSYKSNNSFVIHGEAVNSDSSKMYQISFYIKNEYPVTLKYYSTPTMAEKNIYSDCFVIPANNDFSLFSYEFYNNSNAPATIILDTDNHDCYIDDIYISNDNESPLQRNLLIDSDFSDGMNPWISDDTETSIIDINDSEYALKIKSNPDSTTNVSYNCNLSGKKGDIYNLSFWYKNEGVLNEYTNNLENVGNKVNLQFISVDDLNGAGTLNIPLIKNDSEWQYFSDSFMALEDYSDIYLNIMSQYEANNLYITNVMLIKQLGKYDIEYDSEGNLLSISNLSGNKNQLKYDKNNQLVGILTSQGNHYKIEYDNHDFSKILREISPTGICNEYEYDSYNNPTKTIVKNINKNCTIENDKKYIVRLKGTKKYLDYDFLNQKLIIKESNCNHLELKIKKENDLFRIKLIDKYLSFEDNDISLVSTENINGLFKISENDNGSYSISPYKNDKKYLIVSDNEIKFLELELVNENAQFYFEEVKPIIFIENIAEYTEDGKFLKKIKDSLNNEIIYDYDDKTGLLNKVVDPNGHYTKYNYNTKNQIVNITNGKNYVNYIYNQQDQLSSIETENNNYNFTYDNFLNKSSVKIGNKVLIANDYDIKNGNLKSITYGNGSIINYFYDIFNRINNIDYQDIAYKYFYDNLGNLFKIASDNETHEYYYDYANRINKHILKNNNNIFEINYKYDKYDNIESENYGLFCDILNEYKKYNFLNMCYYYNSDDLITKIKYGATEINYEYDELGRIINKNINGKLNTIYDYYSNGNKTSLIVKSISIDNDLYEYKYDNIYNITDIYLNGKIINHYEYDNLSELIKETDFVLNETINYVYDATGNLLKKIEYELNTDKVIHIDTYEYNNSDWKDQLTKFNNVKITYDEIGNPLTYGTKKYTWVHGRQLKSFIDTEKNLSYEYKYDHNGIRTSKKVNNIITEYYNDGNDVIIEKTGENVLYFIRDRFGELLGLDYNGNLYYYVKNLQNDIIGIKDSNFKTIATYTYNAFGKLLFIKDSNNMNIVDTSNIAYVNPYRYRSYYYDNETGMYYLKNRYYDPNICRFINSDNYLLNETGFIGTNMYAYANNNSVTKCDPLGTFPLTKIGAFIRSFFNYKQNKKAKDEIQHVQDINREDNVCPSENKIFKETLEKDAKLVKKRLNGKNFISKSLDFRNMVKDGAEFDLKNQDKWKEKTIYYDGMYMEPQDIGNYHFGYIGRAAGFDLDFLLFGASLNQIKKGARELNKETFKNCFTTSRCDDPRDQFFIKMGAKAYDREN